MKKICLITAMCSVFNLTHSQNVVLHESSQWKECSFQLDPSLTQTDFHKFTQEAGLAVYFRSLSTAKPLGKRHLEFSLLEWRTRIDETTNAWNNTFVHPHSTHYLVGGPILPFPGLCLRAGLTNRLDAGIYWTVRPGANYGLIGGQIQYAFINDTVNHWSAAARLNLNSLYGPKDLNVSITGLDVMVSKSLNIYKNKILVSPYFGISTYLSRSHEKSSLVDLKNELIPGLQTMLGASAKIYFLTMAAEYNVAKTNTLSYRMGFNIAF